MEKLFIILGIIALVLVAGFIGINIFNKFRMGKLFAQISMTSQQVPRQKRNSFILLMLVETIAASKKRSKTTSSKLNNQKYIEIQMMQMSKILNKSSQPQDKTTKQALKLLTTFHKWEAKKRGLVEKAKKSA